MNARNSRRGGQKRIGILYPRMDMENVKNLAPSDVVMSHYHVACNLPPYSCLVAAVHCRYPIHNAGGACNGWILELSLFQVESFLRVGISVGDGSVGRWLFSQ